MESSAPITFSRRFRPLSAPVTHIWPILLALSTETGPLMRVNKRIRTVLYGDQRLSSAELEVLHTPAMQRLYGLRQLGLTDRVFIDASHSRIHHVVGVLEQVDKLVSAIVHNLRRSERELRIGSEMVRHGPSNLKSLHDLCAVENL